MKLKKKYKSSASLNVYGKNGDIIENFSHETFAKHLVTKTSSCMISYNDSDVIKKRFKSWKSYIYKHRYSMKSVGNYHKDQKNRNELILFNYTQPQMNFLDKEEIL